MNAKKKNPLILYIFRNAGVLLSVVRIHCDSENASGEFMCVTMMKAGAKQDAQISFVIILAREVYSCWRCQKRMQKSVGQQAGKTAGAAVMRMSSVMTLSCGCLPASAIVCHNYVTL